MQSAKTATKLDIPQGKPDQEKGQTESQSCSNTNLVQTPPKDDDTHINKNGVRQPNPLRVNMFKLVNHIEVQTTLILFMQTVANWFSPLAMQDAFCLVCWFSCSFMSEACACFGEWL